MYSDMHYLRSRSNNTIRALLISFSAINIKHFTKHYTPEHLFQFENIQKVTFAGYGYFSNNFGSVISAYGSTIFLRDSIHFYKNSGDKGGCINLSGQSLLYFMDNVKATFKDNHAFLFGGAIYTHTYPHEICSIQVMDFNDAKNRTITMTGNTALLAGNAIYALSLIHI